MFTESKLFDFANQAQLLAWAAVFAVLTAAPALADRVPSHLAGMAASLYKAAAADLEKADPEDSHGWATIRADEALRKIAVHRWQPKAPPQWGGQQQVADLLELDLSQPEQATALGEFLLQAQAEGTEAATLFLLKRLDRPTPEAKPLATLVTKLNEALSAGFGDLARRHVIESDDGPHIALDWQPEQGRFRIEVEEPGSEHVAPYRTTLEGRLEPTLQDEAGEAVGL